MGTQEEPADREYPSGSAQQELSTQECQSLLATRQIGRLGVLVNGYPLIFVVNYGLDEGAVIIRTAPGTKLAHANHANVSFQVDQIDERTRSGWSVLVLALAEEVTEQTHRLELLRRTQAHAVQPWAPGQYDHWLRLIPHQVTGRRIVPGQLPPLFPQAYL